MGAELPILSFLCSIILAAFLASKRVRSSVSNLALVLWLIGHNLIQGINAIIWTGNVGIHVPVWCDIVTKLMLGATIAVPGALLCLSRELELLSSQRQLFMNPRVVRNRMILEIFVCYFIPIIYMSMHVVAQDHRFDIAEDLGCSASIHPSNVGFFLMWTPPLFLCGLTFVFSVMAIHHSCERPPSFFSQHLSSRGELSSATFRRRISITFTTVCALIVSKILSVFSLPRFSPWGTWSSSHKDIFTIDIVNTFTEVRNIELACWGVVSVSILYILLTVVIGEESLKIRSWIKECRELRHRLPRLVLPPSHSPESETVSRSPTMNKHSLRPLTVDLKSGWDDMLDCKSPTRNNSSTRSKSSATSMCSSPTPSSHSAKADDEQFMASTISYLGSPPARVLGIGSEVPVPPPVLSSPPSQTALTIPPRPTTSAPVPGQKTVRPVRNPSQRKPVPQEGASTIAKVLDVQWPVPPASPTPSISRSQKGTSSRSHSPASSAEEKFGYPLYPTITPPHRRARPFDASSISSLSEVAPVPPSPTAKPSIGKRSSIRSLSRSWSRERIAPTFSANDVILMSVVQETV